MNKEENKKPCVEVYTDGACSGNPGKGGYGAVLRYKTNNGEFVADYQKGEMTEEQLIEFLKENKVIETKED